MARLSQGILGGISGKIGNVVGSSWKGIAVVKSKPLSVANPRSSGQIAQRNKMSFIVAFATQILADTIKPLWDRFAQKQSGYNAFVQANISNVDNNELVDPSLFQISKGKMEATDINSVVVSAASGEALAYFNTDAVGSYALESDLAYLVAYNSATGEVATNPVKTLRSFGEAVATFKQDITVGQPVYCWLAFRRADGTIVSSSSYESATVTA